MSQQTLVVDVPDTTCSDCAATAPGTVTNAYLRPDGTYGVNAGTPAGWGQVTVTTSVDTSTAKNSVVCPECLAKVIAAAGIT